MFLDSGGLTERTKVRGYEVSSKQTIGMQFHVCCCVTETVESESL